MSADVEVAVVVDGDADARVLVLADPGVLRAPVRPGSFESRGGSTRGTDGTTSTRDGAVMHHKRAHRKCEAARAARARKRACAPSAGNREPCAFAGARLGARLGP